VSILLVLSFHAQHYPYNYPIQLSNNFLHSHQFSTSKRYLMQAFNREKTSECDRGDLANSGREFFQAPLSEKGCHCEALRSNPVIRATPLPNEIASQNLAMTRCMSRLSFSERGMPCQIQIVVMRLIAATRIASAAAAATPLTTTAPTITAAGRTSSAVITIAAAAVIFASSRGLRTGFIYF
jgi:hypothetical protein